MDKHFLSTEQKVKYVIYRGQNLKNIGAIYTFKNEIPLSRTSAFGDFYPSGMQKKLCNEQGRKNQGARPPSSSNFFQRTKSALFCDEKCPFCTS
jgi:hypothetical protein